MPKILKQYVSFYSMIWRTRIQNCIILTDLASFKVCFCPSKPWRFRSAFWEKHSILRYVSSEIVLLHKWFLPNVKNSPGNLVISIFSSLIWCLLAKQTDEHLQLVRNCLTTYNLNLKNRASLGHVLLSSHSKTVHLVKGWLELYNSLLASSI